MIVLMHLLVLGAFCRKLDMFMYDAAVLMHLLVLGAFCLGDPGIGKSSFVGLNAPSGAGCFLPPASGRGVVAPLPGGWSATGSASTPRDRPAPPLFNHFSAS